MILLNCNDFSIGAFAVKENFIHLCEAKLIEFQKDKTLGLLQILDLYSMEDIRMAFRAITFDRYNNLLVPSQSSSEFILRLLEYGGESIRATHFISLVKSDLYKYLATIKKGVN